MTSGQSPLVCICIGQVRNAFAYVPGQRPPLTVLRHFPVAEHALCFIGCRCCISSWVIVQCVLSVLGVLRTVRLPRPGRSRYVSWMRVKGFRYFNVNSNRGGKPQPSTRKSSMNYGRHGWAHFFILETWVERESYWMTISCSDTGAVLSVDTLILKFLEHARN